MNWIGKIFSPDLIKKIWETIKKLIFLVSLIEKTIFQPEYSWMLLNIPECFWMFMNVPENKNVQEASWTFRNKSFVKLAVTRVVEYFLSIRFLLWWITNWKINDYCKIYIYMVEILSKNVEKNKQYKSIFDSKCWIASKEAIKQTNLKRTRAKVNF